LTCANDKVSTVRRDFVSEMLSIKPYFDPNSSQSLEMMDILTTLVDDPDREVREAAEHTDFELLQNRKKNKENLTNDE
jgi:hypothetical protein